LCESVMAEHSATELDTAVGRKLKENEQTKQAELT
jgi:hypothetical protein